MENIKIGIVVLNYNNYEETIRCVDSILTQSYKDYQIVIVDNGSMNDSIMVLSKAFSECLNIKIFRNETNLGYAKGNNIGIRWLLHHGYQHIIVCNSDVEFTSPNIFEQIVSQYETGVGVITPIIKNLDGTIEMRAQYKRKLLYLRIGKELLRMMFINCKKKRDSSTIKSKYCLLPPGINDTYLVITGSVFMLTPDYFSNYNGLFPKTFLYVEELATLLLIYKSKLKCAIANTDIVLHKGGASTELSMKPNSYKKNKMISRSAKKVMILLLTPRVLLKRIAD